MLPVLHPELWHLIFEIICGDCWCMEDDENIEEDREQLSGSVHILSLMLVCKEWKGTLQPHCSIETSASKQTMV
ncbi:hypothetical protein DACRYDRAFT_23664 [Dacryopinax primogenitus]|uniref:Uncharacterized protein n=1 Tax=Dacryopinax primogenitus (strain DJM 731) TaxID=1858805 RepID=M5G725_DACPD|nr:uncharacterized protein DACRYDRAFT_23664 [Dacryopinax primogenitus]EJT99562.1 hypothetical protein DACRYDRAFT_23664 [Dacryopinax primogenitus]